MLNGYQGFTELCECSVNAQNSFIEENKSDYKLFMEILGFQHEINKLLAKFYNEKYSIKNKSDEQIKQTRNALTNVQKTEQHILILYTDNIQCLFQAITPLEDEYIHVFENIIRHVYESIPKMIYMLHHPEETDTICEKEYFSMWVAKKKYDCAEDSESCKREEFVDQFIEEQLSLSLLDFDPVILKKLLMEKNNQYEPSWYRKRLYSTKHLKELDYEYAELSMKVHANIFSSVKPKTKKEYLKMLIDLSFFNLLIMMETYHKVLDEIQELDNTKKFIIKINEELKNHVYCTCFYPDHAKYKIKTVFKSSCKK